ncbi:MAG: hypothetical protein ACI9F9_001974 [Candidatus Paceibacteria bacterium]|jgi:hypothetical protein
MIDPKMELLSTVVVTSILRLTENPEDASAWAEIKIARDAKGDEDPDLGEALLNEDLGMLRALAEDWQSEKKHLPSSDREVLKRAVKAFRKSLKVTQLNHESSLSGGMLSGSNDSRIIGITPPPRYPDPVWRELARQGRLKANHNGTYELPLGG